MTAALRDLADRYPGAAVVERAGRVYPVAVRRTHAALDRVLALRPDRQAWIDPELLSLGRDHLEAVRSRTPGMHDGAVAVFDRVQEDGTLQGSASGYFAMVATCDALQDEWQQGEADVATPLRERAEQLATPYGGVLASGRGRAAAVGVSVICEVPTAAGPAAVLGRRRASIATDAGMWHVVPSGMVEPDTATPLLRTAQRELAEELKLRREVRPAELRVLGVAFDLLRLRPDVCLHLRLTEDDVDGSQLTLPGDEFSRVELVPLIPAGLADWWEGHPPASVTAAAAGALALLEDDVDPPASPAMAVDDRGI
jgi:8-oxo-dGTP pyrophosphatase MutT (NUDIX family)